MSKHTDTGCAAVSSPTAKKVDKTALVFGAMGGSSCSSGLYWCDNCVEPTDWWTIEADFTSYEPIFICKMCGRAYHKYRDYYWMNNAA